MDVYQIGVHNDNVVSIGPSRNGHDNNSQTDRTTIYAFMYVNCIYVFNRIV